MKCQRRQFLHMAAGATALPIVSCAGSLGQGTPTKTTMVVERTQYFAKPGLAAEVLAVRRKASAVRVSIGLPAGEIFVKHPAASAAFEGVRVQMRKLYARFERQVFSIAAL